VFTGQEKHFAEVGEGVGLSVAIVEAVVMFQSFLERADGLRVFTSELLNLAEVGECCCLSEPIAESLVQEERLVERAFSLLVLPGLFLCGT
jgi:hypothetical protein